MATADPTRTDDGVGWKSVAVVGTDDEVGTFFVDGTSGAVTFAPNDGRNVAVGVDVFIAQQAEAKRLIDVVAATPIVKTLCRKAGAQRFGCSFALEERPTGEDCGKTPALTSSCWFRVSVMEVDSTHGSRLGTFLVDPKTSRVVGAAGFCDPVPIAQFRGPGSGCPK